MPKGISARRYQTALLHIEAQRSPNTGRRDGDVIANRGGAHKRQRTLACGLGEVAPTSISHGTRPVAGGRELGLDSRPLLVLARYRTRKDLPARWWRNR
jgi:hypothetical protein